MNKFGYTLAVVAVAMVGLVAATHNDLEFNHGLPIHGGPEFVHPLANFEDGLLWDELLRRGYSVPGRFGGNRLGSGSFASANALASSGVVGRKASAARRAGGLGGFGSGLGRGVGLVGGGAAGSLGQSGFANSRDQLNQLSANSQNFNEGSAEKTQAGLLASQKNFSKGQQFAAQNENEGLHKHQVLDQDKTIIKESNHGVNDVDSFRNSNGVAQGNQVSASESALAAGLNSGRVENQRLNNKNLNSFNSDHSDNIGGSSSASGAAGGVNVL